MLEILKILVLHRNIKLEYFAFSFPPYPGLFQPIRRAGRDRDRVFHHDVYLNGINNWTLERDEKDDISGCMYPTVLPMAVQIRKMIL